MHPRYVPGIYERCLNPSVIRLCVICAPFVSVCELARLVGCGKVDDTLIECTWTVEVDVVAGLLNDVE